MRRVSLGRVRRVSLGSCWCWSGGEEGQFGELFDAGVAVILS